MLFAISRLGATTFFAIQATTFRNVLDMIHLYN
jgi:hypothetical protein